MDRGVRFNETEIQYVIDSEEKDVVYELQSARNLKSMMASQRSDDMPFVSVTTDSFEEEIRMSLSNVRLMQQF
jgi:hypothetical protein